MKGQGESPGLQLHATDNSTASFWNECLDSYPVNWSFIMMTDHRVRPFLSLMPNGWFTATLIFTTHLRPPQNTLTSCPAAQLPAGSTEGEVVKRLMNTFKESTDRIFPPEVPGGYKEAKMWSFTHPCNKEELTHCWDIIAWNTTAFWWLLWFRQFTEMKGFYTSSFALPFSIADFKHSVVSVEFQTVRLKNRWVKTEAKNPELILR